MTEKECISCGEVKPFTAFYRDSKNKTGYRNQCKACVLNRQKKKHTNAGLRGRYQQSKADATISDKRLATLDVNLSNFDVIKYKRKHYLVENWSVLDILEDKDKRYTMEDVIRRAGVTFEALRRHTNCSE